jgi:quinol monooxygenase YgiN
MQRNWLNVVFCALALVGSACASNAAETIDPSTTPPGATAGDPATAEPITTGAEAAPTAPAPATTPAPEASTPAAQTKPAEAPKMPTTAAVAVFEVKDYAAWKTAFDASQTERQQAGIVGHGITRDVANPNKIALYTPAGSIEQLKAYFAKPELKKANKAAGVKGQPKVWLMNHVESKMAQQQGPSLAVMVTHEVKDYDAWKPVFESDAPAREAAGILGYGISRDADKPNVVYIYMQASDAAKVKAFTESKELKAKMKDAGVKGKPEVLVLQEAEMIMYPALAAQPVAQPAAVPAAPVTPAAPVAAAAPAATAVKPAAVVATPAAPIAPTAPVATPAAPGQPATK